MPVDEGYRGGEKVNVPNPDPSLLTTQQLRDGIENLKELIGARLDAIDTATNLRLEMFNRVPGDIDAQIMHLKEVIGEKLGVLNERFHTIDTQFRERDVRTTQASGAADDALKAALQAAKELVGAQGEASAAAAVKSETSFALALDTSLFTADGWKTMGTVQAGDIVFAEDGEPTSVVATSGIFRDSLCYTVQFSDGSRIVATADHRWHVHDVRAWQGKWGVWKTLTTQEIVDSGWHRLRDGGNGYRYRVATNAVVQTPEAKLPIDPYILGYWLGDGSSASPTIIVGNEDKDFVTAQIEDAGFRISKETEQVSAWGTSWALYFTNDEPRGAGLYALLSRLGVRGVGRKHVPDLYLAASPDQRRALLAGLLDSDGTISKAASRVTFNSTSTPLAEGVRQLARSLGYRAVIHRYGDDYHVTWPPTENVFRNPRKTALFRPSTTRQREWASITDVQVTATVPTRCLTVEHASHVFLVGRGFIPTCNTKQIDQIGTIIQTLEKALDARITELKERIDRGEGSTVGAGDQRNESRMDSQILISVIAAVLFLVSIGVTLFVASHR